MDRIHFSGQEGSQQQAWVGGNAFNKLNCCSHIVHQSALLHIFHFVESFRNAFTGMLGIASIPASGFRSYNVYVRLYGSSSLHPGEANKGKYFDMQAWDMYRYVEMNLMADPLYEKL